MVSDVAEFYEVQGSKPILTFYLGMQDYGTRYHKIYIGVEELISSMGGFAVGLAYFFSLTSGFLMQINHKTKMIHLILGPAVEDD